MRTLARSSARRRGRRVPARAEEEPWEQVWAARRVSPRHPVPGGGRCARSGIPERPAPGRVPSLQLHRCSVALLSDLLRLNLGGGGPPWSPGALEPGRQCARAPRGSAGGRDARGSSREFASSDPGEGRLSPPRSRAGAAKAIRRPGHHAALPRTLGRGRGRSQVADPSQPLSFSVDSGPSRASVVTPVKWGRGLCSRSPSGPGSRPGIQRAGPAAGWVCSVRADQVPRQVGACGHTAAGPGRRRPW